MGVTAIQDGSAFMVPRRGEPPDVGYWSRTVEPLANEVEELAAQHCRHFPSDPSKVFAALVTFGLAIIALLQERAKQDVDDGLRPPGPKIDAAMINRIGAARLGRILDWVGKGQDLRSMALRFFAVCAHVRASAIDFRTNQDAATELGLSTRQAVNRVVARFRRDLGADYPGESGKSNNTKRKCKKSRITNLQDCK